VRHFRNWFGIDFLDDTVQDALFYVKGLGLETLK
jgi:hypothetical protein